METLILISLVIVIFWVLFRPITKKEIERFNDKDNWPNMNL
jgi:hypothetical protein